MKHPDTKPVNFIVANIGDNDFTYDVENALSYGYERGYHRTMCPILWKRFIVNFMVGESLRREFNVRDMNYKIHEDVHHLHEYFIDHLTVKFEQTAPTPEYYEGAYLDINIGDVYQY